MEILKNITSWTCGIFVFALFFPIGAQAQNTPRLTGPEMAFAVLVNNVNPQKAAIIRKKPNNIIGKTRRAPQLTDAQVASVAVTANKIDIEYAKIALRKSNNKDIRGFAKTMKKDHTMIINKAVDLAQKLGVTPKTNAVTKSLLAGAKKTKRKLNSLRGRAFNKAYIANEVKYHEAVINAIKNLLIPQTSNKQLKNLLKSVVPMLESHLKFAKKVQNNLK